MTLKRWLKRDEHGIPALATCGILHHRPQHNGTDWLYIGVWPGHHVVHQCIPCGVTWCDVATMDAIAEAVMKQYE